MKVFTCCEFEGHWPVGTAAIAVAKDKESAKINLQKKLGEIALTQEIEMDSIKEVDLSVEHVDILCDGNY